MAAVIINDDEEDGNLKDTVVTEKLPDPPSDKAPAPAPAPAPAEDKLGKFKGKSAEEIAAAYEALEQRFGKQGAEIGELRQFADGLIRSDLERRKTPAAAPSTTEPSTDVDADSEFFINPRKAVKKLLEEDETLRDLKAHKAETQQERSKRITLEKHPEAPDLVADPEFQAWVDKSKVRQRLFADAHHKYDADAADELFGTYKELKSIKTAPKSEPTAVTEDTSVVDAQKKAAGAATGTTATQEGGKGKPIYSRRKIIELMTNNPEEYEARNAEFLAAYAEGRVRQ